MLSHAVYMWDVSLGIPKMEPEYRYAPIFQSSDGKEWICVMDIGHTAWEANQNVERTNLKMPPEWHKRNKFVRIAKVSIQIVDS